MNEQNPIRWREPGSDAPDGVREVMGSAAMDEVGAERLGRFLDRMEAAVPGPAPAPAASALLSGKAVAGVAVLVGGAVLAWVLWDGPPADRPARPRTTVASAETARSPAEAPPVAATTPTAEAPTASTPAAPPLPSITTETAGLSQPRRPTPLSATDSLAEEVRLLQSARETMGADPAGALRLAEQHRTRFPRGTLAQEREVIAIDALVRQGRAAEAQGRADRFRARYPRSSHLDRLPILRDNQD